MAREIKVFTVTVASAGTPVQLSSVAEMPKYVRSISIIPAEENQGAMYVGDVDVASDHCTAVLSSPGQSWEWVSDFSSDPSLSKENSLDPSSVWIDSAENGDAVHVTIERDIP